MTFQNPAKDLRWSFFRKYQILNLILKTILSLRHCVKSVRIRSFSGPYFPHSELKWRDTVLSSNAGKYEPGKLRIRTLFTQCIFITLKQDQQFSCCRKKGPLLSLIFIYQRLIQFSMSFLWSCKNMLEVLINVRKKVFRTRSRMSGVSIVFFLPVQSHVLRPLAHRSQENLTLWIKVKNC